MKVLKALVLVSMTFSLPLFADVYQCTVGVGWFSDANGQKWENKVLGSGPVDTEGGKYFPIENTKLQIGCGGFQAAQFSNLNLESDTSIEANRGFLCMLAPVSDNSFYLGIAWTAVGAPLALGVRVGDDTLPMKNKLIYANCQHQPK